MYLAVQDEMSSIGELCGIYGLSKNHLAKAVHKLARLGYVESVRGKKGGIRLAAEPASINIGAVVRKLEPGFDLVECFDEGKNTCLLSPACRLQAVFSKATRTFQDTLAQYTLADVIRNRSKLESLVKQ